MIGYADFINAVEQWETRNRAVLYPSIMIGSEGKPFESHGTITLPTISHNVLNLPF
jgi:hypothetical protein